MKTITVNRFDNGMSNDLYGDAVGEFAIAKHFDITTYPNRLTPIRTMSSDTASTGIGNLLLGADGNFYGLGTDVSTPTQAAVYKKTGPGAGNAFTVLSNSKNGQAIDYTLFVQYKSAGARSIFYGDRGGIEAIDPTNAVGINGHTLVNTAVAQGFVHPKDDILYIPYTTSAATLIASLNVSSWTDSALTAIPAKYTPGQPTYYGNYLAIPCYETAANKSVVFLWDRDTSLNTITEVIPWGDGRLLALNNLDGVLVGITDMGNPTGQVNIISDYDSIQIKIYAGGVPQLVKEIATTKLTTTNPDASVNPRVNFISRGKFYFSINVVGGSTSPSYYGLWALSKSKLSGRYAVTLERYATSDNSETGVLAAVIGGDYTSMVHTAEGTITTSISASVFTDIYGSTSIYESLINPNMSAVDRAMSKKLVAVAVHFVPMNTGAQVVMKARVDSALTSTWKTLLTKTTSSPDAGTTVYETAITPTMAVPDGRNLEFRLESTYGAQITGFTYVYETLKTNL